MVQRYGQHLKSAVHNAHRCHYSSTLHCISKAKCGIGRQLHREKDNKNSDQIWFIKSQVAHPQRSLIFVDVGSIRSSLTTSLAWVSSQPKWSRVLWTTECNSRRSWLFGVDGHCRRSNVCEWTFETGGFDVTGKLLPKPKEPGLHLCGLLFQHWI